MSKKYNGWTNYETWNVKLWMDNDYAHYTYWQHRTECIAEESEPEYDWETPRDAARVALMDELKAFHEENRPEMDASTYTDLLGAALSEVNWYEIAESLLDAAEIDFAVEA